MAGGQQPQGIEEFRKALLKAVDDGLLVIGESARDALLYHIERSFGIRHQEIPERLEGFHEALGDLLGAGARVVETLIAKNLYDALGLNLRARELDDNRLCQLCGKRQARSLKDEEKKGLDSV